jgi:ATP-dependent 26S proteasome regulatory subunit
MSMFKGASLADVIAARGHAAATVGPMEMAVEAPLPDAERRRRLLALYAEGLETVVEDWEPYVNRTHGASCAFLRELLRRAALFAATNGQPLVVRTDHLDAALDELTQLGGHLGRKFLGFRSGHAGD